MTEKQLAVFWLNVLKDSANGCWLWRASVSKQGYGNAWNGRTVCAAHRLSWEIAYGPIPEGRWVLHNCPVKHNRRCVNPVHLKLGDVKENSRDAVETGGIATGERHGSKTHPEAVVRGERHPATVLTDEDVMTMRQRWAAREASLSELAAEKGLTTGGVGSIVAGRAWAHLPILRRSGKRKMPADHPAHVRMRAATHCPKGHEYTEANTYWQGGGRWRSCRACKALWAREHKGGGSNQK